MARLGAILTLKILKGPARFETRTTDIGPIGPRPPRFARFLDYVYKHTHTPQDDSEREISPHRGRYLHITKLLLCPFNLN